MNTQKILDRFAIIADLSLDEAARWIGICEESQSEISGLIKEGIDEEENENRLNAAAAVLAFYKYTLYVTSRSITASGTATTLSDRKNILSVASEAWNKTRAGMSDVLKDSEFIFQSVEY